MNKIDQVAVAEIVARYGIVATHSPPNWILLFPGQACGVIPDDASLAEIESFCAELTGSAA